LGLSAHVNKENVRDFFVLFNTILSKVTMQATMNINSRVNLLADAAAK